MSIMRRAVARAGRNRVFPRKLPDDVGGARFYASTEGGLKYLRPNLASIDTPLLRFAAERVYPGAIVWDIGANLGLFSFAAAGLAGPTGSVLAVEPDTWLVSVLRRSASLNPGCAPVHVLPAAVADVVGIATFLIAADNRATNALGGHGHTATMGGVRESQHVPTITLDFLLGHFDPPDVVKVDVEGVELRLLAGATQVLTRARPVMTIEVERGSRKDVTALLHEHRYDLFDGETGKASDTATWATVAVPVR